MTAGPDHRYIPELDGLRALAIVLVLLFHSAPSGPFSGGFLGVDLFFVLSAFLITSILDGERARRGAVNLSHFYLRRLLRLMPALLLFLAAYVVIAPMVWPGYPHLRDAALAGFYLSDYSYAFWRLPYYLQHSWSLSVEEHFYLIWPLLLPVVTRLRHRLPLLLLVYLALGIWRLSFAADWADYYYRFDTRTTGLVMGVILYFALPHLRLRPIHGYAALILLALLATSVHIREAARFIPLAEVAAALLIGCAVTGQAGLISPLLRTRPAILLGKLSYGIYLWHFPIAFWVRDDWGFAATALFTLALSTAAAAGSYVTVEAWGRRMMARDGRAGLPARLSPQA